MTSPRAGQGWPDPPPHPSGAQPPEIPAALVPRHVAIVMDGNGRWAHARGLPRTEGHRAGEASLMDVLHGAIAARRLTVSAYAFSTENWRRTPEEVRFLMGFNKDVIRRRRDELAALGVRIRWAGRRPRLWRSVIDQLEDAEQFTRDNDRLTLQFCVNYGGRAEIVDAVRRIARDVAGRAGSTRPRSTSAPSPPTSTSRACPTSTCSSGPRGSSARRTSCSGSPPTPS